MEDIIINKLCYFCINKEKKCKNCIRYKEYKQQNYIKYKCENYKKDETKIIGYNEKWIDNTLLDLEINKFK